MTSRRTYKPSIIDFITLPKVQSGVISPDASKIAYLMLYEDLQNNGEIVKCRIVDTATFDNYQITDKGWALGITWINNNDLAEAERITLEIIKKLQKELNHVHDMLTELYLNEQYIHISSSDLDNSFSNLQTCLRILNKHMEEK